MGEKKRAGGGKERKDKIKFQYVQHFLQYSDFIVKCLILSSVLLSTFKIHTYTDFMHSIYLWYLLHFILGTCLLSICFLYIPRNLSSNRERRHLRRTGLDLRGGGEDLFLWGQLVSIQIKDHLLLAEVQQEANGIAWKKRFKLSLVAGSVCKHFLTCVDFNAIFFLWVYNEERT